MNDESFENKTCLCVYILNSLRNYVFILEIFRDCRSIKRKKEPRFNHQNLACVPRHINSFLSQNIDAVYMKDSSVYRMYLLLADAVQVINQQGGKKGCLMKMRPTFAPILFARSILRVHTHLYTTPEDSTETPMGHWLPVE